MNMAVSREEFRDETIRMIDAVAVKMFDEYDESKKRFKHAMSGEFIEARGFFKGTVIGLLTFSERCTDLDMSKEKEEVINELERAVHYIDTDESREKLLDGCYKIVDYMEVMFYDKKMEVLR